ncbi:hypothetical protein HY30_12575 [Hyphomonas chukchiensis]|uniref:Uncharacterized protein n=1 Tax=Hyphomonas chukchiensis TaxID=1280947 RepID=A0A062URK7_9PROT|nr:hypothetical protein HY30_12575 [Hyphomonas chukchiensis]
MPVFPAQAGGFLRLPEVPAFAGSADWGGLFFESAVSDPHPASPFQGEESLSWAEIIPNSADCSPP